MKTANIYQSHDHQHCIDSAILQAKDLCQKNGVRLTKQREQILRLVWQSHMPLGAYTLIEQLSKKLGRLVAPPTVYRALEFLAEQQLIHRIHSLNAFVGCPEPGSHHQNHFLICRQCGQAEECADHQLKLVIDAAATMANFHAESQSLEVVGLCGTCQGLDIRHDGDSSTQTNEQNNQ